MGKADYRKVDPSGAATRSCSADHGEDLGRIGAALEAAGERFLGCTFLY